MTERHHLLVYGGTFAAVGDRGDISGVRGPGAAAGSPKGCSSGTPGISAAGS